MCIRDSVYSLPTAQRIEYARRAEAAALSAMPIAQTEQGGMQRDYWFSSARTLARLDTPESIGAEAARRTLRRLDARRVPTQRVPIVFALSLIHI